MEVLLVGVLIKSQDNAVKLDLLASSKKCKDANLYWETYQT